MIRANSIASATHVYFYKQENPHNSLDTNLSTSQTVRKLTFGFDVPFVGYKKW